SDQSADDHAAHNSAKPVVVWYSREVRWGPVMLLAGLLIANTVSAADLPTAHPTTDSARWVLTAICTTFLVLAFTRPPWQTLVWLAVAVIANALTITAPFEDLSDVGPKLVWAIASQCYGTTIALAVMLGLREQAELVVEQRRRTAAA